MRLPFSTRDLPSCSPSNGTKPIVAPYVGNDADWLFPSYDHLYKQSEEKEYPAGTQLSTSLTLTHAFNHRLPICNLPLPLKVFPQLKKNQLHVDIKNLLIQQFFVCQQNQGFFRVDYSHFLAIKFSLHLP